MFRHAVYVCHVVHFKTCLDLQLVDPWSDFLGRGAYGQCGLAEPPAGSRGRVPAQGSEGKPPKTESFFEFAQPEELANLS